MQHGNFPTLYKLDSKNKLRVWNISVSSGIDSDGDFGLIKISHGVKDGQQQIKEDFVRSGKNIGKANETNTYTQAVSEAQSKFNKQLDKGYTESIPDELNKPFRPMLAHRFDKYPHKIQYPAFSSPKLDGIRSCIKYDNGWKIFSRKNKEFVTMGHILKEVEDLNPPKDWILDGELYTHNENFDKIIGAVKRDEENDDSVKVRFHQYDLFIESNPDESYGRRFEKIVKLCESTQTIDYVEVRNVYSQADIFEHFQNYIKDGYEGAMLRNIDSVYKVDGRSYDLLKVKEFLDAEFKIVDVERDKDGCAVFRCVTKGKVFGVRPMGTVEQRQKYLSKPPIGELLTVRFFEYTKDGIPRFPVGVCVRDYE